MNGDNDGADWLYKAVVRLKWGLRVTGYWEPKQASVIDVVKIIERIAAPALSLFYVRSLQ